VSAHVSEGGKISSKKLEQNQLAAHALAYLATELEAARQLVEWSDRLSATGPAAALERKVAEAYVGELLRELAGGINLGPCESISPSDLWLEPSDLLETVGKPELLPVVHAASSAAVCEIARRAFEERTYGAWGLEDETLDSIREEFRKFADKEVIPIAQDVHRKDVLIPMALIDKMAQMGVFGLTIPEEYGGQGLGKVAMCVVTEELSRGYIGVGSLGTRSEIAAELIMGGGTEEQKRYWPPASPRARQCPRRSSPSRTSARTSRTSARRRRRSPTAVTASTAPRRGSRTRRARIS
jgi:(2S)-methylsuccinyl-CoA dehydrogenase